MRLSFLFKGVESRERTMVNRRLDLLLEVAFVSVLYSGDRTHQVLLNALAHHVDQVVVGRSGDSRRLFRVGSFRTCFLHVLNEGVYLRQLV